MTAQATDEKTRAADQLVSHFEGEILTGALAPGEPLPTEREIVQSHGVSRTVVREAVRTLASKGLITAPRGFRPVVAKPGYEAALGAVGSIVSQLLGEPHGIRNLFELRRMMEASLVRHAARLATAEHISAMELALAANEAAIDTSSQFYDTDIAFHRIFFVIPDNPVLPAIHKAYTDWLSPQWVKMPRVPNRNAKNYAAHKAIFEAILRRDPDRAEAALNHHLDAAWEQVSSTFKEA